ncbi:hypothetical protein LX32DRAFT_294656 [Colletotrichum zoysiae]|uniref:Uncharacterized protein n=1 Tax=Colletotrichum zoysiae TaxID=1216348 RepID=A0AAD9H291_9PEZI|nr:hypothetical protein LX32DRAFT_294656 [Colletotrichum zoysiae]
MPVRPCCSPARAELFCNACLPACLPGLQSTGTAVSSVNPIGDLLDWSVVGIKIPLINLPALPAAAVLLTRAGTVPVCNSRLVIQPADHPSEMTWQTDVRKSGPEESPVTSRDE